jgi:hypothetical protein
MSIFLSGTFLGENSLPNQINRRLWYQHKHYLEHIGYWWHQHKHYLEHIGY